MKKIYSALHSAVHSLFVVEPVVSAAVSNKLETAPTKYIEANGVNFSYRTIGESSGIPLILFMHFSGTMDAWDPAVVNALAKERLVIAFNNRGVGKTNGNTPNNVEDMTNDALTFINALGYKKVDILGFSLGGFIAQKLAADQPDLVNKVILVGTSPQGAGDNLLKVLGEAFARTDIADIREYLFFSSSDKGKAAAKKFVERVTARTNDRDPESGKDITDAQANALITWGATDSQNDKILNAITQPVLIVQGSNDTMLPTKGSLTMFNTIKNAQLILYPDSNHGSFYEFHDAFVNSANFFLSH